MTCRLCLMFAILPLLAACATPKQTYQVQLHNLCAKPICVGLIKQVPPGVRLELEEGWTSPENILRAAPALADRHWGTLIQPGQTTVIGPAVGSFPPEVYAALRIYEGNATVEELTTYRRTDPDRLEIMLWPGKCSYVISKANGKLAAKRED